LIRSLSFICFICLPIISDSSVISESLSVFSINSFLIIKIWFIPLPTCVWEINFDMLTDLYESSEFEKEFDIIETQLKNMGWSLYLWRRHYEEGDYEYEEPEDEYEEPEEEEEINENFNPQDSVYLKYYCYPTEFPIGV